jgi:arylsulfatase A-like enzyme
MASKPNILIFCVDQMASASLGCNGNPDISTPHLDALAKDGCSFQRAYCANPVCSPARASIFTGLLPRQHGLITNGTRLPESIPTLPSALAAAGYRTHAVGKLHLQPYEDAGSAEYSGGWKSGEIAKLPENYYGFQSADFLGGHVHYCFGDYTRWLEKKHPGIYERYAREQSSWQCPVVKQTWKTRVPPELHYNEWIAERSITYLQSLEAEENFFLWCSFPDPHHPFAAAEPYCDQYDPSVLQRPESFPYTDERITSLRDQREQFRSHFPVDDESLGAVMAQTYGMISHVDHCIGRVMNHLQTSGLLENTIVIFTADHGEYLGSHGLLFKNIWMFEELLRIPMIWRVPGAGGRHGPCQQVVSHLDLVPTLLDYAGIGPEVLDMRKGARSAPLTLPGQSLRAFLEGKASLAPEPALTEYDEDWFPDGPFFRIRTMTTERYKLVVYGNPEEGQLFDLESDPHELNDLWNDPDHCEIRADLITKAFQRFSRNDRLDQPRHCGA